MTIVCRKGVRGIVFFMAICITMLIFKPTDGFRNNVNRVNISAIVHDEAFYNYIPSHPDMARKWTHRPLADVSLTTWTDERWSQTNWTGQFTSEHRLYVPSVPEKGFSMIELLSMCTMGKAMTITKHYAFEATIEDKVTQYLSDCHPIEISTSQAARSMGHCSDFVQYIYHGNARLVDSLWTEHYEEKARRCPNSAYLHGEYPVLEMFQFGPNHRIKHQLTNIWMPNLEQIRHDQLWLLRASALIICKVKVMCLAAEEYLKAWKNLNSNDQYFADMPELRFMSHSSPDPVEDLSNVAVVATTNISRFNHYYHAYGHSGRKSTEQLLDCWAIHPEWPTLVVVGENSKKLQEQYLWLGRKLKNVETYEKLDIKILRELQVSHAINICPSTTEGYGHYINEARALGLVVVTTGYPPMNEFVDDNVNGILIKSMPGLPDKYQGLGPYFSSIADVHPKHICSAIRKTMNLTLEAKREMGRQARERYEQDTAFMISSINSLQNEILVRMGHFDPLHFVKSLNKSIAHYHNLQLIK